MIERYSTKEMKRIFSLENKFNKFLKVEIECCKSLARHSYLPMEDVKKIEQNAYVNLDRILELEEITHHDVIAFTRAISETLGEEKKWVHYLLTSTDVVDTANGIIIQEANNCLKEELLKLKSILKDKAIRYQNTPCIGRTHGIHADITSFGLKFALYYDELSRNISRFELASKDIECGKISGAVGNFANVPSFVQDEVCKALNLQSSKISTQVLQRDRHAFYISTLVLISSTLEKIALEIRLLQQTEIHEAEEFFSKGQKGSSAMPHKRNPIASENIMGCSRIMRGYMLSIFEDIPLWHERDISHSSVERVALNDAVTLLHYMLKRMSKVIENLIVYEDRMKTNIYMTNGVIFSQRVMTMLIQKGLSREESYDMVQVNAQKAYNENLSFIFLIKQDKVITKYLSEQEIDCCFDIDYFLKNVDEIYHRVGIK